MNEMRQLTVLFYYSSVCPGLAGSKHPRATTVVACDKDFDLNGGCTGVISSP